MIDCRPWLKSLDVVFLLTVLCLVSLSHGYVNAETDPGDPAQGSIDVFNSPWIDHIIPSKSNDLFVILKNGLTVLIRESHGSKVVSSQVLVKTGSIYEGERMGGGLSHYLEHVVSGGTTSKLTETQIKARLQAIGGVTNAYTSYDHTGYFINTTREYYKEALSLLLAYVTDCQFDETEYQREKGVILQEFQMGENDPSRQLWYLFMKTAYRKHPIRYPVIGEKDIFLKMNKEDLIAHYRRWYTPEDMVVSVAGDVDKEEALGTVLGLAGTLQRAVNPPCVLPAEPPQLTQRSVEKSLPMAKIAQAQLGFRTVALTDPDLYPLDVLAVIMGDGRTSRLYQTVRDQKGLVLSISAGSWTPAFAKGQFLISMDLAYENLSKAIDAVWEELSDVQRNPVSQEALKRAKNKIVADHIFGQESVQSQASQLASDWVATGDPYFSENYVSKIQGVTPEDMMRAAKKYFKKDQMTLAVIKPPEVASKTQEIPLAVDDSQEKVHKIILPNQMTLLLKRNTAAPIVALKFMVKGGLRFEPVDKPGLSHFMASLLTKGTKNRSKIQIAKAIEDLGGSIRSSSGHNVVSVSVSVLKEHLDTALDLLSDVVLHPTFPESEIEKQRRETLMAIQRLDEHWMTEITRLFKRHYYRKHPYRNDIIGSAKAVESLSVKDIRDFYEAIMMPNNAVLAIFGDIDPESVASMVEKAFEDFQPGILEQPIIEMETQNIVQDETFEIFNEKTSAAILVGYNGLTLADHDRPAVNVLDAIVSGIQYPSGWLHDALRGGDKNLVYYVHAYPAFGIDGGYFGIIAQTTLDNCEEVLKIVLDKMAQIQNVEVDPATLERAKNMCITTHEIGLERIASQASSAAVNEILGLGYDYDEKYAGLIQAVSAGDVLRVAKKLLSHHLIVVTKPRDQ
ncbi:MAG: insulinase family protein [Deltaproteobacteria bacterium]|nr:insulinase family protein [Deltaproteobacteria bacterium]MBW2074339.1 insulinase family protein [Deltaproteobacteria bacterium]